MFPLVQAESTPQRLGHTGISPLGRLSQQGLRRSPRATHYEKVRRFMVVDGWCHLRLALCATDGGWRRWSTAGVGRAGARRGHRHSSAGQSPCHGRKHPLGRVPLMLAPSAKSSAVVSPAWLAQARSGPIKLEGDGLRQTVGQGGPGLSRGQGRGGGAPACEGGHRHLSEVHGRPTASRLSPWSVNSVVVGLSVRHSSGG